MKKTLTADFSKGNEKAYVRGLYQHDYGAILKVTGIEYAEIIRVDFAGPNDGKAHPVVALQEPDGGFQVKIPKENTDKAGELSAYIYITDAESGFTIKEVILPIIERVEADPDPSGEKTDPFADVIEEIKKNAKSASDSAASAAESEKSASESATQAEKSAVQSRESVEAAAISEKAAATSATAAAESEKKARESATAARSAADQASKSATAAAESANTATKRSENATQSATNAARSAESATQSAETAKTAADTAGKSASAAQQAVRSAAESASTATVAAQTATTAAGKAAESATTANQSAETAGQKATAAETAAGSAAESETEAAKSSTAAGDSASAAKTSETAAEEAAQTAQEQAEKIVESAEQIEKNKTGVAALEEKKADKTTLAVTERKLDALWKLNQGISYQFEEDSESAYQKEVPSGAKLASVKQIGGKTIVWNQLLNCDALKADLSRMYDVTNDDGIYTLIAKGIGNRAQQTIQVKQNHIYLMKAVTNEVDGNSVEFCPHSYGNAMANMAQCYNKGEGWKRIYQIIKAGYTGGLLFQFYLHASEYPATMQYKAGSFQVFDLTQMFGSGNEPATVEAFESVFPEENYPYNAGELRSACVSEVVEKGKNLLDVSNITDIDVNGKGSIRQGVIIPVVKGTYKISALKAENNIFVKRVVGNNYATPADLSSKEVSLTFDTNGSIYVYATDGKIEGVQVEKGSVVTQYSPYHKNTYPVSEAVRQLPGYGWSAGNVCNEVDFENKKYIQRVAAIDLGKTTFTQYDPANHTKHTWYAKVSNMRPASAKLTCAKYTPHSWISMNDKTFLQGIIQSHPSLSFIYISDDDYTNVSDFTKAANGVMLYYELAEPIITDISDIVGDTFQEPFEVEAGGTLTFQNSHDDDYRIPVSSTEEYLISLAEVAK